MNWRDGHRCSIPDRGVSVWCPRLHFCPSTFGIAKAALRRETDRRSLHAPVSPLGSRSIDWDASVPASVVLAPKRVCLGPFGCMGFGDIPHSCTKQSLGLTGGVLLIVLEKPIKQRTSRLDLCVRLCTLAVCGGWFRDSPNRGLVFDDLLTLPQAMTVVAWFIAWIWLRRPFFERKENG